MKGGKGSFATLYLVPYRTVCRGLLCAILQWQSMAFGNPVEQFCTIGLRKPLDSRLIRHGWDIVLPAWLCDAMALWGCGNHTQPTVNKHGQWQASFYGLVKKYFGAILHVMSSRSLHLITVIQTKNRSIWHVGHRKHIRESMWQKQPNGQMDPY